MVLLRGQEDEGRRVVALGQVRRQFHAADPVGQLRAHEEDVVGDEGEHLQGLEGGHGLPEHGNLLDRGEHVSQLGPNFGIRVQKQRFEFGHGANLVAGNGATDHISLISKVLKFRSRRPRVVCPLCRMNS